MRAAFGRERDAGRRAGKDEAGILVAGIVQRIEPARDEGIVERADGEQPLTEMRMGKARLSEQEEEVHLSDAKLEMLAFGREFPFLCRWDRVFPERVGDLAAGEQRAAVHPG